MARTTTSNNLTSSIFTSNLSNLTNSSHSPSLTASTNPLISSIRILPLLNPPHSNSNKQRPDRASRMPFPTASASSCHPKRRTGPTSLQASPSAFLPLQMQITSITTRIYHRGFPLPSPLEWRTATAPPQLRMAKRFQRFSSLVSPRTCRYAHFSPSSTFRAF